MTITVYNKCMRYKTFKEAVKSNKLIHETIKDSYAIFSYSAVIPKMFDSDESLEARGIIFDIASGRVIRRPFEKFFNVGEVQSLEELDKKQIKYVSEKLDGSMIAPFLHPESGDIIWATKRVASKFHDFIISSGIITPAIENHVRFYLVNGITPIFE